MVYPPFIHPGADHDLRGEIPLETFKTHNKGFSQYLNFFMGRHLFNQLRQVFLDVRTFNGDGQFPGISAKLAFFFHNDHFKSLIRKVQGSIHTGNSTAYDQGPFIDNDLFLHKRFQKTRPGHRHADEVLCLDCCAFRVSPVDP